ncbi:glycosyltransferase family 2 protein [Flavobacterium aquariorum]|uniref:Glycosyltransferase family 2 protein n=1 Tax=Flavobacterium aquariorum TaxID=2217670 RepID=A0A2W7TQE2_9FLAO|nr:glycosyltransferase family 2 protein [Flavobacterium aquariorum]PZX92481.1 glycosyltransferase family 2 protein [Flavobacterium aquariorum]
MISVCIATYNGEKYIKEQIDSILAQLSVCDELIISDDNSNDNTVGIIKKLNDTRIRFFLNNEKGYTSNFENALKQVKGDVVFLSDQDDIWEGNKVEVCLEELKNYDLVVSDCKIINSENEIIADSYFKLRSIKKTSLGNLFKFSYLGCCLAFRSDILKKALPFPANRQLCTHDNWLFLVGSCFYKHKILNNKLILYRRHDGNASTGGLISMTSICFKIKYRIYLSIFLIKRAFIN